MDGRITRILENAMGLEYGFIVSNGISYYFDGRYLFTGTMSDFNVDDYVEFEPQPHPYNPHKQNATQVKLAPQRATDPGSGDSQPEDPDATAVAHADNPELLEGYITSYRNDRGYGFVDSEYFFHISNVMNADQFDINTREYQYRISYQKEKSERKEGEFCAHQITILSEESLQCLEVQKQPDPVHPYQIGYIILFMPNRKYGYIISEDNYKKEKRGDIYFEQDCIEGDFNIDTFANHYKVSFTLVEGTQKRATNIRILDTIPRTTCLTNNTLPIKPEDIAKYDFVKGETLVVKNGAGRYIGSFVERTEDTLCIETEKGPVHIPTQGVTELLFCGLITSFDILSATGRINNMYAFRHTNVINKQLANRLKLGKYASHLCLYSLIIDGTINYINTVDYFTKELSDQLQWRSGRIQGLYQTGIYFSVDKNHRCYAGMVSDDAVNFHWRNKDFLRQEVFYKVVSHRTADARRESELSSSIIDIRAKYQSGKIVGYPNSEQKDIQCGSQTYHAVIDLNTHPIGTDVRAELCTRSEGELIVTDVDYNNLTLPTFSQEIQREKSIFDAKTRQADLDGDYDLQIKLNEEMLEQMLIYPERAIGTIFQICVKRNDMHRIVDVMQRYGYQLEKDAYHSFNMQLDALMGNNASAAVHARHYLTFTEKDELRTSFARAIQQRAVSPESLRDHILEERPFDIVRKTGKIGLYDNPTKCGYILWERGKLNFSYKDIVNYDGTEFDLDTYNYFVTFEVDRSKRIPKAVEVQIYETTHKDAESESVPDDNSAFLNADDFAGDIRITNLLEFRRDQLVLDRILGYLPPDTRKKINNNEFIGGYEDAKNLIRSLQNCYDSTSPYRSAPSNQKPDFLLAAAKIHKNVSEKHTEKDSFWNPDNANAILFEYAFRYLNTGSTTELAEVEYYCESIFMNDFPAKWKHRMKVRCLKDCFIGTEKINTNRYLKGINSIFRHKCRDVLTLARLLLNLPEQITEELLKDVPLELTKAIAEAIVVINNDVSPEENADDTVRWYYKIYRQALEEFKRSLNTFATIDDSQHYLGILEKMDNSAGKYLFDSDQARLSTLLQMLNTLVNNLNEEDVDMKVSQLQGLISNLKNLICRIEEHPSRFSFEVLRPFMLKLSALVCKHIDKLYTLFAPELTVEHYSLSNDGMREILSVSNAKNHLPATNVKIGNVLPYGNDPGFAVDIDGNRMILGSGQTINGGKAVEISIPIRIAKNCQDILELSLDVSYNYTHRYNETLGYSEDRQSSIPAQKIQIPLNMQALNPITENKYSSYAGGGVMKPDNQIARTMFFGREDDINAVYNMIENADGTLKEGCMVAIYGQKRCGKSSVMHFLARKIQDNHSKAIVLDMSAEGIRVGEKKDTFYTNFLSKILSALRTQLMAPRFKDLRLAMKEADLQIPSVRDIFSEAGDAYFREFFQIFRMAFPEYSVVLMVDEFTKIYIHMKKRRISEDFLNAWRALVQDNGFVNVVVGQDFMDKFTTDEEVTSQNFGGVVNGLGIMGKKRLSYLDRASAQKMIEEPVRFQNGSSRYRGLLGQEAISRIYDLTGGSAFYLMKFCNALVDYMMEHQELFVSKSLVDKVASAYVFDTRNNPINKTDFDPIFNEYSYRDIQQGDETAEDDSESYINLQVRDEIRSTYNMLKQIADLTNNQGFCNVQKIIWNNEDEKYRILRSLMIRGVLVDHQGRDITTEQIDSLDVKIKVGLFAIWLKKRG